MSNALQHNVGAWMAGKPGINSTAQTAGANAAINSRSFNRQGQSERFLSAVAVVMLQATLASGESISLNIKFQDSANDSDWTDYGSALGATVQQTAAGGAVANGASAQKLAVDLATARQYVRFVATPAHSRAGTDTCIATGVLVLGGAAELPVS